MRGIVQRVSQACVVVKRQVTARIDHGLLVYVGVAVDDGPEDADYLAGKIRHLRVFPDEAGKMNLDVCQVAGSILVVSNFTLLADARQGRRPAFTGAAPPNQARALYDWLCEKLREQGARVQTGQFGAKMSVTAANNGPINVLLDSKGRF